MLINVNWVPDHPDAMEAGGFVKPKGWRGGGANGKPDRYRGVGRLSDGYYMAKLCFKNGTEKVLSQPLCYYRYGHVGRLSGGTCTAKLCFKTALKRY
jgi:hypothetical protein